MCFYSYEWIKTIKFFLVLSTWASGFTSGILFGKIAHLFQNNCWLYANVTFKLRTKTSSGNTDVHVESTTWGGKNLCDLVTFEGVVVSITSFIWLWFFLNMGINSSKPADSNMNNSVKSHWRHYFGRTNPMLRSMENSQPRNALFILPPILVNTILCSTSMIKVALASAGYQQFCSSLCASSENITCNNPFDGCRELQHHRWVFLSTQHAKPRAFTFHNAMTAALVMSWIEPVLLATHVLVIMAQVYLDANPIERVSVEKSPGFSNSNSIRSNSATPTATVTATATVAGHSVDLDPLDPCLTVQQDKRATNPTPKQINAHTSISFPPFDMFKGPEKAESPPKAKPTEEIKKMIASTLAPAKSAKQHQISSSTSPDKSPTMVSMMPPTKRPEVAVIKRFKRSDTKLPK